MKEAVRSINGVDRSVVLNFDLIFPQYGEICGGSIREDGYDVLCAKMRSLGLNLNHELDWYLELRKYGSVPHGGFGVGFDRFLQFLTGVSNIRDVVFMARTPGSIAY
jgi:asparaginyl-tRNA synthetase